ncbi:MAG: hypothetical protein H8D55_01225 [Deltaproteobacteria bacterium]|nr:hypothetical protein [Deltaproteobacteria bacterium]
MPSPFFKEYGNEIEFQGEFDLNRKISNLDSSVPARTQGRTSAHRERSSLLIYLKELSKKNLLKYPLKIIKRESPDFFVVCSDGTTTSLEETEAGTEDYQRAMTKLEKCPQGTILETDLFKLEKAPLPKGDYKKALRRPEEKLIGNGWEGDSMEREWCELILDAINKKTKSLNQPNFKSANRYELLIYDNSHVSGLNIAEALPLLKKAVVINHNLKSSEKKWHSISVIKGNQLFYNVAKEQTS